MIDQEKYRGKHVTEIVLAVQQYEPLPLPRVENAKTTAGNILYQKTVYHEELFLGGIPVLFEGKHINELTFNKMMDQLRSQFKSELISNGILR